jgi:hypothetical protein
MRALAAPAAGGPSCALLAVALALAFELLEAIDARVGRDD